MKNKKMVKSILRIIIVIIIIILVFIQGRKWANQYIGCGDSHVIDGENN